MDLKNEHFIDMQPPKFTNSIPKVDTLVEYMNMGFKLVPLDELSQSPTLAWSEILCGSRILVGRENKG